MTGEHKQQIYILRKKGLAFNQILEDKNGYISAYEPIIETLTDTAQSDAKIAVPQKRCNGVYAELEQFIKDNANHVQDQEDYRMRYVELAERYEALTAELAKLETAKLSQTLCREKILRFLNDLRGQDGLLQEKELTMQ